MLKIPLQIKTFFIENFDHDLLQESLSLDIQLFDVETLIFRKVMRKLMFAPELFLHTLVIVNTMITNNSWIQ